jgi:RNA polymerase sigma factor (sigma-70 family)
VKTVTDGRLQSVISYLRQAVAPGRPPDVSDAELLERFAALGDQSAFELLVWRHSRAVLGVCRRVLRHHHDAEDAFQAAFLALARRASSIRGRESVGGWLYRVAYRVALKAGARTSRRSAHERPLAEGLEAPGPDPGAEAEGRELGRALDEQVNRLPAKYREVVALCCLGGKSRAEAARELGCSVGAVESRLARARARLRAGLARRGLAVPAAFLAAGLGGAAVAPAATVTEVVRAAALVAAGRAVPAGVVPARVAALTEGVLRAMQIASWKRILTVCVVAGAVALAAGLAALRVPAASDPRTPKKAENVGKEELKTADPQLSSTPLPYPALAVLDHKGRVAITRAFPRAPWSWTGAGEFQRGAPGPGLTAPARVTWHFRLEQVRGFDTSGKKVEAKDLTRRLRRKVTVLVSADGKPVDPLHLRLFKDGLLVLVVAPERQAGDKVAIGRPPAVPGGMPRNVPPGGKWGAVRPGAKMPPGPGALPGRVPGQGAPAPRAGAKMPPGPGGLPGRLPAGAGKVPPGAPGGPAGNLGDELPPAGRPGAPPRNQ